MGKFEELVDECVVWQHIEKTWAKIYPIDTILKSFGVENRASLPDAAFAVIDKSKVTGKDKEGRSKPDTARHLPHHGPNVKSSTENSSVNLPLLRNALARMNQIKASGELKSKARAHLAAHAKALLKTSKFKQGVNSAATE